MTKYNIKLSLYEDVSQGVRDLAKLPWVVVTPTGDKRQGQGVGPRNIPWAGRWLLFGDSHGDQTFGCHVMASGIMGRHRTVKFEIKRVWKSRVAHDSEKRQAQEQTCERKPGMKSILIYFCFQQMFISEMDFYHTLRTFSIYSPEVIIHFIWLINKGWEKISSSVNIFELIKKQFHKKNKLQWY